MKTWWCISLDETCVSFVTSRSRMRGRQGSLELRESERKFDVCWDIEILLIHLLCICNPAR